MIARCFSYSGRIVAALLASIIAVAAAASAQTAPPAATSAVISGTIRSGSGAPIPGASITISGPVTMAVVSDANGAFSVSVPPGVYSVSVRKSGFNSVSLADLPVVAGTSPPLTVSLTPVDLSSLRTIGSVNSTSRGGGSAINTSAATSDFLSGTAFQDEAAPQINDVLQHMPDVTLEHMGDEPDTYIIVGGQQPYETQVLIDGHPLALGQNGAWSSTYFPSYLLGGAETQTGPGNTTPFANIAVGGTVNLLTPGFTQKPTAELNVGTDTFFSQYSNLLATNTIGKLGYVVDIGAGGLNGPYYESQHCDTNGPGPVAIIAYCGDSSGSLLTRGSVLKLRYSFTPQTSFEVGFVGAWGEFSPQGAAWGTDNGTTTIVACLPGTQECTNPANLPLVGQTIHSYTWYPGSFVYNNQDLFDAQLRTAIGNNTLLVRPYIGSIEPEIVDGTQEGQYPQYFAPGANYPACVIGAGGVPTNQPCYQAPGQTPGTQLSSSGPATPNYFESAVCPVGSIYSYSQLNSPANTIVTKNGQEECFQYPYTTFETDKLYGTTFSFLHPMGDSLLNFTYDFHGQSTFAFVNAPTNITVPTSAVRYSTFSLTGDLHVAPKISIDAGLYDTLWSIAGVQPHIVGVVQTDANGNTISTGLGRHIAHFDPHVALIARPNSDTSVRAAWGTSATFPFAGQVSGNASYTPFSTSYPENTDGSLSEKNPSLDPEVSTAYDLGMDHRFKNGSVFSADIDDTVIHNVFQDVVINESVPFTSQCNPQPTQPLCILALSTFINAASLHTEMATLHYRYAPRTGFGFNLSASATRSIVSGIPASALNGNASLPVNGQQICGEGASPAVSTCIPYLKGYGQLTYTAHGGTYFGLGVDYEGKNNSYLQPPLAIVDFTFRRPVTKSLELLVSAENLLNTNNYNNLPIPGGGVDTVAATSSGLTSYTQTLIPTPPRTIRAQLRLHVGR
jgi:hypothetical protein